MLLAVFLYLPSLVTRMHSAVLMFCTVCSDVQCLSHWNLSHWVNSCVEFWV